MEPLSRTTEKMYECISICRLFNFSLSGFCKQNIISPEQYNDLDFMQSNLGDIFWQPDVPGNLGPDRDKKWKGNIPAKIV